MFFAPVEGWLAFVQGENALAYFTGTAWEIFAAATGSGTLARLGINAAASDVNRLTVRSRAALFAPDLTTSNNNVQVIVSKSGAAGTASHVFQNDFSGRAEFGLIGNDDFALKVSSDGAAFRDVFRVGAATGEINFSKVPLIGGTRSLSYTVPSRAALAATQVPADVDQVETRGYAAENGGGGGRYERVPSLPADGLGIRDAAGGFWGLVGDTVTARQAGATGNGTTDDTGALNRAFASGRTVHIEAGIYSVRSTLRTGAIYQRILGDGRGRSVISVARTFPLAAPAVIKVEHQFVTIEELEVRFDQSSASSRATLVAYPPAIDISGQPRARLLRLRITEAYDGVLGLNNPGGALLDDVECGSLNVGFRIAGALDTVEMRNCRVWPYNFAGNPTLMSIFSDGQTIGFRIGRVDDLKMTNCTPFRARVIFEASDGGIPFGTVHGLALDGTFSRVDMLDGDLAFSGLYCTSGLANDYAVLMTGGNLALSDFSFRFGDNANLPIVHVNGVSASCQVSNGIVELGASVEADAFRVTSGQLAVKGVRFELGSTVTRTGACIRQLGGLLLASGNTCSRLSTGAGAFIGIATNGDHVVVANNSAGWRYDLPAATSAGLYGPNHDGTAVNFGSIARFLPVAGGTVEGGEIQLAGAGTNNSVNFENSNGNARIFGLTSGKALIVSTDDGTARLTGSGFELDGSFRVGRGLADEPFSTSVGSAALGAATNGTSNTAVGRRALATLTGGSQSTAVGVNAGAAAVGADGNTFVGFNAGIQITGSRNTGIGRNALISSPAGITNSSALGDGAFVNGSNEVQLGNSATTTYVYGAVGSRSDARDKADVRDTVLGLDFIMRLRPVDFRWNYREDYAKPADLPEDAVWEEPKPASRKRTRFHHGFIAQEVAAVAAGIGTDFGGYQDHTIAGGGDVRTLGYDEMIAPMVKAIQALAARIDALEER